MSDFHDRVYCGYLVANLTVAANMRAAKDRDAAEDAARKAWDLLAERAKAIGCELFRCCLDPDCDGSCGCGPGLRDREDQPVGDGASDEPSQDLAMFTLLVERLEANGGVRK